MVPPTILRQLARLRFRERAIRLAWGLTLGVTIAAAVMAVCCLTDWIIDLRRETPFALRRGMLIGQVLLWTVSAVAVLTWALIRRVGNTDLALWVEDRATAFGHRLISALQLNEPNAKTEGMSPALIAAVTREAEDQTAKVDFAQFADHRRLERSALMGFIVGAALIVLFTFWYDTVTVLVARQFLADRDIPRSLLLTSVTKEVWPSGEEVTLRFRVRSQEELAADLQGEVRIEPDDAPSETYPLVFESSEGRGGAVFSTKVRPATVSYHYRAWLRDGRTRQGHRLQLEPRPAIVKQDAWIRLPAYVGLRPNGQPYEILQQRGDIVGLAGTTARIAIQTQKPIHRATLELLGKPAPELLTALPGPWTDTIGVPFGGLYSWLVPLAILTANEAPVDSESGTPAVPRPALRADLVLRKVAMKVDPTGQRAEGTFDLRPGESVYRITVEDQYGFVNLDPPRRSIRLETQEPPVVALLPERFPEPGGTTTEEDEVEGVPILFKSKFRVAYTASSAFGLGNARFRYRINEGEWQTFPLRNVPATAKTGPFDLRQGAFVKSGFFDEIELHRVPSSDPDRVPPGTEGGGRFDFKTAALDKLQIGDKIEFYIEVFDRNPADGRSPGRSETRQKTVVNLEEYFAWKEQVQQEESRIRQLETKQRNVFSTAANTEDGPASRPLTSPLADPRKPKPRRGPGATVFLRDWQIIGPFPNTEDGKGFDTAYPPELEKAADLTKEYDGLKGKVRWKVHHSPGDKVDLEAFLKHSDAGVAYAVCWFRSDEVKAVLKTGSDDGIKVWIDRKLVLSKKTRREAVPGEDRTPLTLNEEDWHELLVKVDNRTASWAFYLELRNPKGNGSPLDAKVRATPPGDEARQFVRDWQLIGPFPNVGDHGRDKEFPPETDKVDLDKAYDGIAGKVRWKLHQSERGRISLDRFFERPFNESNLAYAVCWVKADKEREAILATGSDDGIKVWINGRLRVDVAGMREAEPGKDINRVPLNKGWNEIRVKVDNRFGRWAFYLELRDPDTERPLDGLELRTTPPKEGD